MKIKTRAKLIGFGVLSIGICFVILGWFTNDLLTMLAGVIIEVLSPICICLTDLIQIIRILKKNNLWEDEYIPKEKK